MPRRLVAALFFVLFTALACSGLTPVPVPDDKKDFIGTWVAEDSTLIIEADGMLSHKNTGGAGSSEMNAPIQEWRDDAIVAGIGPIAQTFTVEQAPAKRKGTWMMKVNKKKYTRK
jgi:hypothetical protein